MGVRDECRHYSTRTTAGGETVQRCRLGANQDAPFACPDACLFFEDRGIDGTGWTRPPDDDPGGLYDR